MTSKFARISNMSICTSWPSEFKIPDKQRDANQFFCDLKFLANQESLNGLLILIRILKDNFKSYIKVFCAILAILICFQSQQKKWKWNLQTIAICDQQNNIIGSKLSEITKQLLSNFDGILLDTPLLILRLKKITK